MTTLKKRKTPPGAETGEALSKCSLDNAFDSKKQTGSQAFRVDFQRQQFAQRKIKEIRFLAFMRRGRGSIEAQHDAFALIFAMLRASAVSALMQYPATCEHIDPETGEVTRRAVYRKGASKPVQRSWKFVGADRLAEAVAEDLRRIGIEPDAQAVAATVEAVHVENCNRKSVGVWSGDRVAAVLQVTKCERDAFEVWLKEYRAPGVAYIGAVDWPASERRAAAAQRRKERKRERMKMIRSAKKTQVPRRVYEEQSVERAKPWKAEGISRRTWFRKRNKSVAQVGVTEYNIHRGPHTCATGTFGGEEFRRALLMKSADALIPRPGELGEPSPQGRAHSAAAGEACDG